MKRLNDKIAIVTGGGTGIGEAIAKKFAREGAKVLVAGFGQDPVEQVVDHINQNYSEAIGYTGDLSIESEAQQCVQTAINQWGKLDVLINNAGVFPKSAEIDKYSTEAFESMLKNNIRATFLMTKYSIPQLQITKGCVVSAGSEAGKLGIAQNTPYGGTKGFIHSFMKGVAVEQAKYGIRANCVCPGPVDTAWTHKETGPMDEKMEQTMVAATPLGRRGTTEEIANVYAFLASDEASYVTGALYFVDGGITVAKGNVGGQAPESVTQQPEGELEIEHAHEGATDIR